MTNEQKILLVDRLLADLQNLASDQDMPVMVGTLTAPQGIRGFEVARVGHPVFEYKDRYIIYLESLTPQIIKEGDKKTEVRYFNVTIPYYKHTLSPVINFNDEKENIN